MRPFIKYDKKLFKIISRCKVNMHTPQLSVNDFLMEPHSHLYKISIIFLNLLNISNLFLKPKFFSTDTYQYLRD